MALTLGQSVSVSLRLCISREPDFLKGIHMSHIVSIRTEIRDEMAVKSACTRLCLPQPISGEHRLFSTSVLGLGVQLRDWKFPVVCDLNSGELHFDNYQGRWGDPRELDRFKQSYAVEKTKLEARKQGRSVFERTLADGKIELTVQM